MYFTLVHPPQELLALISHTSIGGRLHNVKTKEKQSLSPSEEQLIIKPIDKAAGAHPT